MSEAGKVSLPTPERIQELKGRYEGSSPEDITFMTVGELTGMLAALEETQRRNTELSDDLTEASNEAMRYEEEARTWEDRHSDLYRAYGDQDRQLAEAQQTIARKQLYIEKLELSRESAQRAADKISKEKGLELFEARQTIARQREALESARSTMGDALSVGEARYKDFDTQLCPWADLSDGVEGINATLGGETQP